MPRRRVALTNDEEDVTGAAGIPPCDLGEIDSGDGRGRHGPRCRDRPVATIDETRRRDGETVRLVSRRRRRHRLYEAGAGAVVVAHTVDVEGETACRRVDLELRGAPGVTLMSVANPWIEASPAPVTSHTEAGVPGLLFSQTMGLIVGPQALCPVARSWARKQTASRDAANARRRASKFGIMAFITGRLFAEEEEPASDNG